MESDGKKAVKGVKVVDIDLSWGPKMVGVTDLFGLVASSGLLFPPFITERAYRGVMKLSPEHLEEELTGLKKPEAINAGKFRLIQTQEKFAEYFREDELLKKDTSLGKEALYRKMRIVPNAEMKNMVDDPRLNPANSLFSRIQGKLNIK